MLARLWLVLLCALALAALPGRAAGAQSGVPEASALEHERPTIEAAAGPYSADARASERAESLVVVVRMLATADPLPTDAGRRAASRPPAARLVAGWCDCVQCRRLTGAQLLRYATPPPPPRG